jgi:hypothetical protein
VIRSRWNVTLAAVLSLAVLALGGLAQEKKPDAKTEEPAPKPTPEQQQRIDQLIKQLGSDNFEERERAQHELLKIGLPALESLRLATKDSEFEVSRRAAELVGRLEELLTSRKDLAPKKVHLKLKDVSVADAVAELNRQSGYPIRIGGDRTKLNERKITLDTGEVPFWQAFDRLCLAGGLTEVTADPAQAGSLQVVDGTPRPTPTSYAGAVRLRVLPDSVKRKDGVAEFVVELSIEPRFRQPKVLTAARIETAHDDQDRTLTAVEPSTEKAVHTRAPAALRLGEQSKRLKDVSGTVVFETVLADKVLIIDQVPASVGKTVRNDEGQSLRLDTFNKQPNGDIQVRTTWGKTLPRNGPIVIGPNTFNEFQPELRDDKGLLFQATIQPAQSITISNMNLTVTRTIVYRPQPGSGEAAELSLSSNRRTALRVPFSFADVPLP